MLRIARSEIVRYGIRARAGKIRHFAAVLESIMRSRTACVARWIQSFDASFRSETTQMLQSKILL
jgi:hypothetical protein